MPKWHSKVAGVVRPGSDEQKPSECNSDEGHKVYDHEESTGWGEQETKSNGKGTDTEHEKEGGSTGYPEKSTAGGEKDLKGEGYGQGPWTK